MRWSDLTSSEKNDDSPSRQPQPQQDPSASSRFLTTLFNSNATSSNQEEDSDGVMLDRDQPLHSTPVLVARPPPPTPEALSCLTTTTDSIIPTMLLPPSQQQTQQQPPPPPLNHQQHQLKQPKQQRHLGSVLHPRPPVLNEHDRGISSASQTVLQCRESTGNVETIHQTDSYLDEEDDEDEEEEDEARVIEQDNDPSGQLLLTGDGRRRTSERYMEEASFETNLQLQQSFRKSSTTNNTTSAASVAAATNAVAAELAKDRHHYHQGKSNMRSSVLVVAPSGKFGRRRLNDPESETLLYPATAGNADESGDMVVRSSLTSLSSSERPSFRSSANSMASGSVAMAIVPSSSTSVSFEDDEEEERQSQMSAEHPLQQSSPIIPSEMIRKTHTFPNNNHHTQSDGVLVSLLSNETTSPPQQQQQQQQDNSQRPAQQQIFRSISEGVVSTNQQQQPGEAEEEEDVIAPLPPNQATAPPPLTPSSSSSGQPSPIMRTRMASVFRRTTTSPSGGRSTISLAATSDSTVSSLEEPVVQAREPEEVWDLLHTNGILPPRPPTGSTTSILTFVDILQALFEGWTRPGLSKELIQELWNEDNVSSSSWAEKIQLQPPSSSTTTTTNLQHPLQQPTQQDNNNQNMHQQKKPLLELLCIGAHLAERPQSAPTATGQSKKTHHRRTSSGSSSSSSNGMPSPPLSSPKHSRQSSTASSSDTVPPPPPPLFWQLPSALTKVFLRILTRLISLESKQDYDGHVAIGQQQPSTKQQSTRLPPRLFSALEYEPPRPDIVYNVARLCCRHKCHSQQQWFQKKQQQQQQNGEDGSEKEEREEDRFSRVTSSILVCILALVERAMLSLEQMQPIKAAATATTSTSSPSSSQQQQSLFSDYNSSNHEHYSQVLPCLIYLLGVWGVAGMTPLVLRRWLALIQSPSMTNAVGVVKFRDALVRALTFCTQHGSLVLPPRCFFTLLQKNNLNNNGTSSSAGMKRAIKGLAHWPFRNDFGMATWFRVEQHGAQQTRLQPTVHLLSVRTDQGAGWTISLHPLADSAAYTLVVSVYDSGHHTSPTHQLTVSGCVLVPRNWYHVAVRHTRSRLKGVFSLSTRQQLVLMLDGKIMANESLSFPRVESNNNKGDSHLESASLLLRSASSSQSHSSLNLEIEAAVRMEGQLGALYIFKENVSDASFRALYEATGGREHRTMKRSCVHPSLPTSRSWDSKYSDMLRKTRILDVSIKHDDANEIVLPGVDSSSHHHNKHIGGGGAKRFVGGGNTSNQPHHNNNNRPVSVIDFDDPDHHHHHHNDVVSSETGNVQQDLAAFGSKVFIVWDPKRSMDSLAFELHAGAHVILDDHVYAWTSRSAQDVIASIGGVQALIPLFRSMIAAGGGSTSDARPLSILANLFHLLAAFVHEHPENARELLRCGGIDVIEQLLLASKKIGAQKGGSSSSSSSSSRSSLFAAICANDRMATELVESLLVLRSASQHYVGLETKVFGRLLFNLSLWLGGNGGNSAPAGAALHLALLPALSFLAKTNPEKIKECVGARDMIHLLRESAQEEAGANNGNNPQTNRFLPRSDEKGEAFEEVKVSAPLTTRERRHVRRIVLGMIFEVLASGTVPRDLGPFLRFISVNLETTQQGRHVVGSVEEPPLRHQVQLEVCTLLLFLLQLTPLVPGLMDSFAHCCGSVQAGVGWILSVMVKSPDEKLIAVGIRCVFAYLKAATKGDDHPMNMSAVLVDGVGGQQETETGPAATTEAAAKTVALAAQSTVASFAKGLASMGPGGRAAFNMFPSKLTSRVVYKLLWHLLKTHRSVLGTHVRSALLYCMSDAHEALADTMLSEEYLLTKLVIHGDEAETSGCWFSCDVAMSMLQKSGSIVGRSLQNKLAIATVLRLLRYLPAPTTQQWLIDLISLVRSSRKSIGLISSLEDWQSCLFHLVSEIVEELSVVDEANQDAPPTNGDHDHQQNADIGERLDLCLELYATLLGHLLREGGEKALDAIEHAASLQRVCVNGQVVLLLILSSLCADLFDHGTLLEVGSLTAEDWKDIDLEIDSLLLKQSAKLVTDAILSNGTEGLDMAAAVRSWRSLRHLAEVVVALVSKSGLGVVDLFAYNKHRASALDSVSGGLHGIRLPETRIKGTTSVQYSKMLGAAGVSSLSATTEGSQDARRDIDRRLCVTLATQVLTLLDAFIFPDSLDTTLPASQLHGLALVRNSEPRLGAAQGPLIASAIRLSFLLMSTLEPCSVRMLQCVSRLRCLLHWALELIRESSTVEGTPTAFQDKIASMDRLLLAVVLHCHRSLGRCAALLAELESPASVKHFGSKDVQKKHYRRLLRVALELRDVVTTAYRGRNEVVRTALSTEAVEDLRSSLEGSSGSGRSISREAAIKEFLSSRWVSRFQDVEIRADLSVPEQVTMESVELNEDGSSSHLSTGIFVVETLANESSIVQADFEKALDVAFEGYLETQRKWAETEHVRDLEFDGDDKAKKLAEKHELDIADLAKDATTRRLGADNRWNSIFQMVVTPWLGETHWRLAEVTDRMGRRTLMVQNRLFASHKDASYDADKSSASAEPAASKGESNLTELIRRNAEAFTMHDDGLDDDSTQPSDSDSVTDQESSSTGDVDSLGSNDSGVFEPTETEYEEGWDKIDTEEIEHVDADGDVDGWARAFIWSETESVVARFEPVMIVSLQTYAEGKVLLTTHGLYFKNIGNEINAMTRSPVEGTESAMAEQKDRRWRLSRLTEIHGRRYLLRPQALELFFADSQELLLNFPRGGKERDRFHAKLRNNCKVPMLWSPKSLNPRVVFRKSRITELWRKRKISNFEYLMALNRMAGRSFNDVTQYPVFPWVLADYTSEAIDLCDSRVYRDLTKPIGALNPDRLSQLLERFKDLELFGFPEAERFLYGSHYSSPGIVLHFLIRQEPFTTMAIELQSGRFDCPDRLFYDLAASWDGCMTSTSDMKELVPEFFCLPEMFLNTNKFPLGKTQSGKAVDNVGLPPWAKGSAFEFVRIHRQALESEYVSQNLHHWIDLVFGFKQRGEEAEAAHNVFHHLSYEGSVDLDKIADEVDRAAAESHIQNFGQTPSQLVQVTPHPERYSQEECWRPLIRGVGCTKQLRCQTPSKQFGNMNSEFARGPVIKIHALSDGIVAVYGDLSIGSYRWYPTYKNNRLRMDRLRPLNRRELSVSRDAMKRGSLVAPDELNCSDYFLSSASFALTIGGRLREDLRRNAILPSSRLMSGTETTLASAEASAMLISCGFWDDTVKVHSADSLRVLASESGGHEGPIHCLATASDGFMLTGGLDGTCRIWVIDHADMATATSDAYVRTALGKQEGNSLLTCCHILWGHETPVMCVDLDSELDVAVSGSQGGLVCVHSIRRGDFIRSFSPPRLDIGKRSPPNAVTKLALGTSGDAVVHMADHGLHAFTINGVLLASTNAGESLNDMKVCSNGEFVVTGGDRCKVLVRQVSDLHVCSILDLSKHGPIRCVTLTPDELNPVNQFLFVGSADGSITIVDRDPNAIEDTE